MKDILNNMHYMILVIAIVAVIVFLAMMVDLAAGLYKAHLRGDARRSEALKRTGYKFCLYEGSVLIAAGIDACIHIAKMFLWFGWDMVYGIPLITLGMGIFWCVVEFLSVREKADEKTHSDIAKAEKLAAQMIKILEQLKKGEVPDVDATKVVEAVHAADKVKDLDPIDNNDL